MMSLDSHIYGPGTWWWCLGCCTFKLFFQLLNLFWRASNDNSSTSVCNSNNCKCSLGSAFVFNYWFLCITQGWPIDLPVLHERWVSQDTNPQPEEPFHYLIWPWMPHQCVYTFSVIWPLFVLCFVFVLCCCFSGCVFVGCSLCVLSLSFALCLTH